MQSDAQTIREWLRERESLADAWHEGAGKHNQLISITRKLLDVCEFYEKENNWSLNKFDKTERIYCWDSFDCTEVGSDCGELARKALADAVKELDA